jgi:hypothetical protein
MKHWLSGARLWRGVVGLSVLSLAVAAATPAEAKTRWKQPRKMAQSAAPKRATVGSLITKASDLFDDQRYEESIQTLSGIVVRGDSTPTEKIAAYRLLAMNHIALSRAEEADAAVRALYAIDENFELPATESPKFREFFQKSKAAWEAEGKPGKKVEGGGDPEAKAVVIKHASPAQVEAGTAVPIEGTIDDPDVRVETVDLYFRSAKGGKFSEQSLAYSMGSFRGQIPAELVTPPLVEYYVLAKDKAGLPLSSRGDAEVPLRIVVPEESSSVVESPWFWIPIGVTVVGGAVLTAVLATQLGGSESTVRISVKE